jgi:hypothetical protein
LLELDLDIGMVAVDQRGVYFVGHLMWCGCGMNKRSGSNSPHAWVFASLLRQLAYGLHRNRLGSSE